MMFVPLSIALLFFSSTVMAENSSSFICKDTRDCRTITPELCKKFPPLKDTCAGTCAFCKCEDDIDCSDVSNLACKNFNFIRDQCHKTCGVCQDRDINQCEPNPCIHGNCIDLPDGKGNYTCKCEPGWRGSICDIQCEEDSQCPVDRPFCDVDDNMCKDTCQTDSQCTDPDDYCDTLDGKCKDKDCPVQFDVIDQGYVDDYRGWYDIRECGTCNDYCRWVGNNGSGGDPSKRTVHGSSFWACHRPGNVYFDYKNKGSFVHKKCNKRGDKKE